MRLLLLTLAVSLFTHFGQPPLSVTQNPPTPKYEWQKTEGTVVDLVLLKDSQPTGTKVSINLADKSISVSVRTKSATYISIARKEGNGCKPTMIKLLPTGKMIEISASEASYFNDFWNHADIPNLNARQNDLIDKVSQCLIR